MRWTSKKQNCLKIIFFEGVKKMKFAVVLITLVGFAACRLFQRTVSTGDDNDGDE